MTEDQRLKAAYLDAVAWLAKVEADHEAKRVPLRYVETARDQENQAARAWIWHRFELKQAVCFWLDRRLDRTIAALAVLNRSPMDEL